MGRLSYMIPVPNQCLGLMWPGSTFSYLVTKSTHSRAYGLLDHVETEMRTESALAGPLIVAHINLTCTSSHCRRCSSKAGLAEIGVDWGALCRWKMTFGMMGFFEACGPWTVVVG